MVAQSAVKGGTPKAWLANLRNATGARRFPRIYTIIGQATNGIVVTEANVIVGDVNLVDIRWVVHRVLSVSTDWRKTLWVVRIGRTEEHLLDRQPGGLDRATFLGCVAINMEVEIDRDLASIIGRRQPTAVDLRLLLAISKTTANLERVGDEAEKIARMVKSIIKTGNSRSLPASELRVAAEMASGLLRKALDAFARLDTQTALSIMKEDDLIDREFDGFLRILITYMMEDARTISASLDLLFIAKAIERIGDHAKNIAEFIIYIVKGDDVRHTSIEQIESSLK